MIKKITPLRAIRLKCLDCCVFQPKEVKLCGAVECPLYSFRFGKYPQKSAYFIKGNSQKQPSKVEESRL